MGEADSSVLVAAAGGRGGGAERGVKGGGRERGEGGGHHCSPRRALCRRRRLGGWGSVGRCGRGALRGAARGVLSLPLPVEWLGLPGRPRLPPDAGPTEAAAASPRPCRQRKRRRGLPRRRGEQVRARAAEAVGGSAEGATIKPRCPECRRLPPRPRPAPVLFAPGFAEGFSGGCAGDTGRRAGRGAGAFGQRSGSGSRRKGQARCAPARGERGAGPGDEVTDPGGGDGPRAAGLAVFTSPRESPLPRSGLN